MRFKTNHPLYSQIENIEERMICVEKKEFGQFGRFVIDPKIIKILEKQSLTPGGELYFTEAVNKLAQKELVIAHKFDPQHCLNIGTPETWLEANIKCQQNSGPIT